MNAKTQASRADLAAPMAAGADRAQVIDPHVGQSRAAAAACRTRSRVVPVRKRGAAESRHVAVGVQCQRCSPQVAESRTLQGIRCHGQHPSIQPCPFAFSRGTET